MEKKLRKYLKDGKFYNVDKVRSKTMSSIRGKNNKTTELKLKMALVRKCVSGWQLHPKNIAGKPDIFFSNDKIAVFVDGCFWHGCPDCGHIPKTRNEFWAAKIKRNKERDQLVSRQLKSEGIRVVRIWEHELKTNELTDAALNKIFKML